MATRINLLDWRSERRERRKKQFVVMMGIGLGVGVVVVGIALFLMKSTMAYQQSRNDFLKQEITAVDQKIKEIQELERVKENLLARMRVIEQLQASRSATVHFFDEIVSTLPDGVYLTAVKQQGSGVTIDGIAESNGRVSTYMKNLDASDWFADPRLVVIKTTEQNRLRQSEFTLQVTNLTKPGAPKTDDSEVLQ
ncbi:MAG: PilN domain-containing protein [Gammaproteobacteria bacterium]|nr:PilN domain-containing protein [Gammaproteobacteria bacterium]